MVEGKKISELGVVTSINDGCCFPLLSNGATKRITFAVLLENIIDNLVLPENQQIKELKEKISNIDTSIELTDQQVEKIKKQIEEIQKDVDSQDEIIVKYVKLFEELKEAYDRVEVAGGIIDDELDETSEHAIQNKVIAKLIPEQASEENKLADKDFTNNLIQEKINDLEENNHGYKKIIDSLPYAQIGANAGVEAGYLRKYKKPKKIVVLGNSITSHGPFVEGDGINWDVPDFREMNASRPNSGWVSLVQQYIAKHINPDCKVFKSNVSKWEGQAEGSRNYSHIANEQVYEVLSTSPLKIDGLIVDDILTEDVDIVICQLSENMRFNENWDLTNMTNDFINLYKKIKEKSPNAEMYEFLGFWLDNVGGYNTHKLYAMVAACAQMNVTPIFAPNLLGSPNEDKEQYKAKTGDVLYDGNGNVIGTTPSTVAGHPNDDGFKIMATYTLDALFNNRHVLSNCHRHYYLLVDNIEQPKTASIVPVNSNNINIYSEEGFESTYGGYFKAFVLTGTYDTILKYPIENRVSRGLIKIEATGDYANGNCPTKQVFIPVNSEIKHLKELYRNTELGDGNQTRTAFSPMQSDYSGVIPLRGYFTKEQYIKFDSETTITMDSWKKVDTWENYPSYLIDALYLYPTGSSFVVNKKTFVPYIHGKTSDNGIYLAATDEDLTLPAGTILYIKYAYKK